ncbi:hypothetical protein [Sciscionella marina]|uniref:hypothetical protein n=1 Tax=Sciscionella marina TaxID=508770 RepID=UPI0003802B3E|nr:hypothetical protein [Sciscionella marina]
MSAHEYARALAANDTERLLAMLGTDIVFRSPFSTWEAEAIGQVYRARTAVFERLAVDTVLGEAPRAALLWHAQLDGTTVEASEILTFDGNTIERVDVFLRPAEVLDPVFRAMSRAWPPR